MNQYGDLIAHVGTSLKFLVEAISIKILKYFSNYTGPAHFLNSHAI
jgi:hypothetical protein